MNRQNPGFKSGGAFPYSMSPALSGSPRTKTLKYSYRSSSIVCDHRIVFNASLVLASAIVSTVH